MECVTVVRVGRRVCSIGGMEGSSLIVNFTLVIVTSIS